MDPASTRTCTNHTRAHTQIHTVPHVENRHTGMRTHEGARTEASSRHTRTEDTLASQDLRPHTHAHIALYSSTYPQPHAHPCYSSTHTRKRMQTRRMQRQDRSVWCVVCESEYGCVCVHVECACVCVCVCVLRHMRACAYTRGSGGRLGRSNQHHAHTLVHART